MILDQKFRLAKAGWISPLDFGKLPYTEITYFMEQLKANDPELQKQIKSQEEIDQMLEIFKSRIKN